MTDMTNRESDKFMLRLPDGMRDRIKLAAEQNGRSMNAEIVAILEKEYPPISRDAKFAELRGLMLQHLGGEDDLDETDVARLDKLLSQMNRTARNAK